MQSHDQYYYCVCEYARGKTHRKELLTKRAIACANMFAAKSMYRWKGKLVEDSEVSLVCKTAQKKLALVKRIVLALHSYELPALLGMKNKQLLNTRGGFMNHHFVRVPEVNGNCMYCNESLTDREWKSDFANRAHYKIAVCQCGKENTLRVDYIGTGHDSFGSLEHKISSSKIEVVHHDVKVVGGGQATHSVSAGGGGHH